MQWEFYHVISGKGLVKHEDGTTAIEAGDAFIFEPGRRHQLINESMRRMTATQRSHLVDRGEEEHGY